MLRRFASVLLAAAVLAILSGCGNGGEMSLSDYRKAISELHDGVAWDLGVTVEEMNDLDFRNFYDLPELREVFTGAEEIFTAAWEAADSLYPPQQAEELHASLQGFYSEGAEAMRELRNSLGFFEAVLPMLRDVENLALPDLDEDAGLADIKAAAAEDRRTIEGYESELGGMDSLPGLEQYQEDLMVFLRSIDEAVATMDQAVKPEDVSSFVQFRQWFDTALVESQALWQEAMSKLDGFHGRIDPYIEQGKEIAARIQAL